MNKPDDCRLDVLAQEQLAAQIVSVMDAHFKRPEADEKKYILSLAAQQIRAQQEIQVGAAARPE